MQYASLRACISWFRRRDALLVGHARVGHAARQQLLPGLHRRVEELLLRAELVALRAEVVHDLRQLGRGSLERILLRRDGHPSLAVVLDEVTLGLLLGLSGFLDGALEVALDHLHHPEDT